MLAPTGSEPRTANPLKATIKQLRSANREIVFQTDRWWLRRRRFRVSTVPVYRGQGCFFFRETASGKAAGRNDTSFLEVSIKPG